MISDLNRRESEMSKMGDKFICKFKLNSIYA